MIELLHNTLKWAKCEARFFEMVISWYTDH